MDANEFTQYNPLLEDILQSSAETTTTQNAGGVITQYGPTTKIVQTSPTTYTTTRYVVQETNAGNEAGTGNFQDFDFNFGPTTNVISNLPPVQTTVHESIEPFVDTNTNFVPGTVTTYTTTTKKVNVPVSAPTPVPTTVQTTTYKLTPPEENEILKLVNLQSPQTVETTTFPFEQNQIFENLPDTIGSNQIVKTEVIKETIPYNIPNETPIFETYSMPTETKVTKVVSSPVVDTGFTLGNFESIPFDAGANFGEYTTTTTTTTTEYTPNLQQSLVPSPVPEPAPTTVKTIQYNVPPPVPEPVSTTVKTIQ